MDNKEKKKLFQLNPGDFFYIKGKPNILYMRIEFLTFFAQNTPERSAEFGHSFNAVLMKDEDSCDGPCVVNINEDMEIIQADVKICFD